MFRLIGFASIFGLILAPEFMVRILAFVGFGLLWTSIGAMAAFIPYVIIFPIVAIFSGASEHAVFKGLIPGLFMSAVGTIPFYIFIDLIFKIHMSEVIFGSWFDPTIYTEGFKYYFIEACDFGILSIGPTVFLASAFGSNSKH